MLTIEPRPALQHLPAEGAAAPEHAVEIDVHVEAPVIVAGVFRAHVALGDAGVVDEDVDRAVLALDLRRRRVHGGRLGDVELNAGDVETELPEFGRRVGDAVGHQFGDHHLRARLGQGLRAGEADALPAAGDDGNAAAELALLQIQTAPLQ